MNKLRQYPYNSPTMVEDECTVCMETFCTNDQIRELPICGHTFHKKCVDEWLSLHATCPICRKNVEEALQDEQQGVVTVATAGVLSLSESEEATTTSMSSSTSTSTTSQSRNSFLSYRSESLASIRSLEPPERRSSFRVSPF